MKLEAIGRLINAVDVWVATGVFENTVFNPITDEAKEELKTINSMKKSIGVIDIEIKKKADTVFYTSLYWDKDKQVPTTRRCLIRSETKYSVPFKDNSLHNWRRWLAEIRLERIAKIFESNVDMLPEKNETIQGGRRSGRTTRLVDKAIQDLFNEGVSHIEDHFDSKVSHDLLFDKVVRRLKSELPAGFQSNTTGMVYCFDRPERKIYLIEASY